MSKEGTAGKEGSTSERRWKLACRDGCRNAATTDFARAQKSEKAYIGVGERHAGLAHNPVRRRPQSKFSKRRKQNAKIVEVGPRDDACGD